MITAPAMLTALGAVLLLASGIVGLAVAQFFFHLLTGRMFWRAMVPVEYRRVLRPNDEFRMDPFHHLEEWAALLFLGAFLTFPLIVLDFMGYLRAFH